MKKLTKSIKSININPKRGSDMKIQALLANHEVLNPHYRQMAVDVIVEPIMEGEHKSKIWNYLIKVDGKLVVVPRRCLSSIGERMSNYYRSTVQHLVAKADPQPIKNLETVDFENRWIEKIRSLGVRPSIPYKIVKPKRVFFDNVREPIMDDTIDNVDLDAYKRLNEVPANMAFVDQGAEYENQHLDASQEGRYLREYCVQRAGANHFLHFRTLTDLRSKHQHQDPDKLMVVFEDPEKFDNPEGFISRTLDYDVAYKWAEANRSLGMDRDRYLKMIFGEMKMMTMTQTIEYIESLEWYAEKGEEVEIKWINHINADDVEREYLKSYMGKIEYFAEDEENWDEFESALEAEEQSLSEDDLDRKNSVNPYSSNRLANGNDALSYEFAAVIHHAERKTINFLQGQMFPQKREFHEIQDIKRHFESEYGTSPANKSTNMEIQIPDVYFEFIAIPRPITPKDIIAGAWLEMYVAERQYQINLRRFKPLLIKAQKSEETKIFGKKKPAYDEDDNLIMIPAVTTGINYSRPPCYYFTQAMVSHFWTLIKARKEELEIEMMPEDKMGDDAKLAIKWIRKLGQGQLTTMIIESAVKGNAFDVYGIEVNFTKPISDSETNALWNTYKTI
jgi:hypothetical protein